MCVCVRWRRGAGAFSTCLAKASSSNDLHDEIYLIYRKEYEEHNPRIVCFLSRCRSPDNRRLNDFEAQPQAGRSCVLTSSLGEPYCIRIVRCARGWSLQVRRRPHRNALPLHDHPRLPPTYRRQAELF